jgi:hypothetical protein
MSRVTPRPALLRSLVAPAGLLLAAAVFAVPRAMTAQATSAKAQVVSSRDNSPATALVKGERQLICRGGSIPTGWILVDDVKDPKSCGGENPAVLNTFNVWAVEKFEGRPAGTQMDVCAATPTPKGWVLVDVYRDKTTCGHPADSWGANVKRIRKQ